VRGFEMIKFTGRWRWTWTYRGVLLITIASQPAGAWALTNCGAAAKAFGDFVSVDLHESGAGICQSPMHTGAQMMTADQVTLDFNTRLICFTNGFSTADPGPVTRAIGAKNGAAGGTVSFSATADGAGERPGAIGAT